jgi:glycosyltransferase involved in cell wall biosynthesis
MRAGLPIIASDFPGLRAIVRENNCGCLINPEDIDQLVEAMIFLLSHPEEARKLGENGKKGFETRYNWSREEKKLLTVYDSFEKKN